VRADPHPLTFGRRPLPLRGRGDTVSAASLCWDARPAQDVRTEIWVTMRADRGEGGQRARSWVVATKILGLCA
jgi:hypothetical protein